MRERKDVSASSRSFSGSHRDVLDFLAEEVWRGSPNRVRIFLLETSILDSLTGPSCDALTGRSDGQEMLERLERENLLRRRSRRRAGLVPLPSPLRRLPAWPPRAREARAHGRIAPQGLRLERAERVVADAIEHALSAGDHERAARLMERGDRPDLVSRRGDDAAGLAQGSCPKRRCAAGHCFWSGTPRR